MSFSVIEIILEEQQLFNMSLIKRFKTGSLLHFTIYSLLLFLGLGLSLKWPNILNQPLNLFYLGFIALGYNYFICIQVKNKQLVKKYLAQLYWGFAHICFGILLLVQWRLLEDIPRFKIAFIKEVILLLVINLVLLIYKPKILAFISVDSFKNIEDFPYLLIVSLIPISTLFLVALVKQELLYSKSLPELGILTTGIVLFYSTRYKL